MDLKHEAGLYLRTGLRGWSPCWNA